MASSAAAGRSAARPEAAGGAAAAEAGAEGGKSEAEIKAEMISQVLELQNTLDELSQRVDGVKDENVKLKSENHVLTQYIENLMASSTVFRGADGGRDLTSPR